MYCEPCPQFFILDAVDLGMSCIWIVDGWVNEVDLGENKKHMCGVVYLDDRHLLLYKCET